MLRLENKKDHLSKSIFNNNDCYSIKSLNYPRSCKPHISELHWFLKHNIEYILTNKRINQHVSSPAGNDIVYFCILEIA